MQFLEDEVNNSFTKICINLDASSVSTAESSGSNGETNNWHLGQELYTVDTCITSSSDHIDNYLLSSICNVPIGQPTNKKIQTMNPLCPILNVHIHHRKGSSKTRPIWQLFDNGSLACVIHESVVKKLRTESSTTAKWTTLVGPLSTNCQCYIDINFLALSTSCNIHYKVHVTSNATA